MVLVALLMVAAGVGAKDNVLAKRLSDDQVKQQIIQESIDDYPGNCPCPYNQTRNGRSCGKRSAWSKPGGYSPICYKNEVTKEMVKDWRERTKE